MRWVIQHGIYMFTVSIAIFFWCLIYYPGDYFTLTISWIITYCLWMGQCSVYILLGILGFNV